jgi:hypothetical protein
LSATVSTATDKIIRVDDPEPWLLLIELQANWDSDLPFDLLRRYSLLRHRHRLPVSCVVVLLRPSANSSAMTGIFAQPNPLAADWVFRFHVVRVWEIPSGTFLHGPLALLPLAPVGAVDRAEVHRVISEVDRRVDREATRAQAEMLRAATLQLLALRFDEEFIAQLVKFMATIDLSQTPLWRAIEKHGADAARLEHARASVLGVGRKKFGPAPNDVEAAINSIDDVARLDALRDRVIEVRGWQELLKD